MEILIHVSAPSTAQDDARYQAQAAAILNFQPGNRQLLTSDSPEPVGTRETPSRQSAVVRPVAVRDLQDSGPRSDHSSQNPRSIATTIGSGPSAPLEGDDREESLSSLISVIPDSQPDLFQPLQILDPCLSHEDDPEKPPLKRCRIESLLPAASHSGTSPSPITKTAPSSSHATHTTHATHVTHATHENQQNEENQENQENQELSKPIPPFPITTSQNPNHLLPFLPLEIHSPPPPISTSSFTTHITETLSMLTKRLNPTRTYKPLHQTRPLHQLERGYWAMHLTIQPDNQDQTNKKTNSPVPVPVPDPVSAPSRNQNPNTDPADQGPANPEKNKLIKDQPQDQDPDHNWSLSTFHRFWSFLSEFIGNSRAGWGVWCVLEHGEALSVPENHLDESIRVQLKVYAWGEIAMHVYLLLFLASERRVRRMGMHWKDSLEELVIQMP